MTTPSSQGAGSTGLGNSADSTAQQLGNTAESLGNAATSDQPGIISDIFKPITGFFGDLEADALNSANQTFNTLFFGLIAVAGIAGIVWGVHMLVADTVAGSVVGAVKGAVTE